MEISLHRHHEGSFRNRNLGVAGLPGADATGMVQSPEKGFEHPAAAPTVCRGVARRASIARHRSRRRRNADTGTISAGYWHPFDVFPHYKQRFQRRVFGYWEVGTLLEQMALAPAPAVSGLAEWPVSLEMHNQRDRHERYKASRLSLTALGKAILTQSDDFSRHNPIHRCRGGTELTNDRLWHWDAALIVP